MDEDDNRPPDFEALREMIDAPPIARVVNLILSQAIIDRATSAHIDPLEDKLRVRYRVDNRLHDVMNPPRHIRHALVGRIKMMANMDLAEWRIPQTGSIKLNHDGRDFVVEVSTFPCIHGEKVVFKFIPCQTHPLRLDEMGLSSFNLERVQALLKNRSGLLLVAGQARSGKDTVLRTLVRELNDEHRDVVTIEQSVDVEMAGINQIELNPRAGLTEASVLRSLMRGDPDVIMVDRLHGSEPARLAFEASCARHLVLGGCYQFDASSAVRKMMDMYVELHLVSHALQGVWAQTLLPRLCEDCKQPQTAPANIEGLEEGERVYRRMGCADCQDSGYRGLIAVQEILTTSDDFRQAILRRASASELREFVVVPMRADGLEKLKAGRISLLDFVSEFDKKDGR